ncbi:MAG: Rpn family recombination-promoting nuclease/putative transposase [Selenomonadaceae bacterium]|nr:Rpn family recombination-promoting nuclease/putative transposase [Selenomonadaceae bacterium]
MKHKDTVFCHFFTEDLNRLLSLYQAITGDTTATIDDIKLSTIKPDLATDLYNDISFNIGNKQIILLEHQSTINNNMPLRMLLYLAKLYYNSIPADDLLYKESIIPLPAPEFYVFYNGEQDYPETKQLHLSDSWNNSSAPIELTVTVYNINYGHNKELEEKCHALMEYAYFISRINHHKRTHSLDDAIIITMKDCLNRNYMSDYLSKHKSEVTDLMRIRYSRKDEIAYKAREAAEEATKKTSLQKDLGSIKSLMRTMNWSAEAAMKALEIPAEKFSTYAAML